MVTSVEYEYMDAVIDEELKCSICRVPFIDPVSTPCRHAFCRRCINARLAMKSSCPDCQQSLSSNELIPMVLIVCKMLDGLLVRCLGCKETGIKRSQFNHHIVELCPKTLVLCSAADIRCPWKGRSKELNFHEVSCNYERLRPLLSQLIAENTELKKTNYSHSALNNVVRRKNKDLQDQYSPHAETTVQLTEELNFTRVMICHRNKILEQLIKQCASYSPMDLRQQHLTDLDMGIIVQKSIIARQCTVLELQGNNITDQAIPVLVHSLRNNTTMTKLNLSHNAIGDVGVRLLTDLLAMNSTTIEKLYLCETLITDQGVQYLAEMLKSNTTLKCLGIFQNQLTDQGMHNLADVLTSDNGTLQCLYAQLNSLVTDASVNSLISMFGSNRSLTLLDLSQCGLSTNGIQRLKQAANKRVCF